MTKVLLLGHRGARASRQIPENTLASFELCLEQGCDGFEFDVRLSSDGHAVVCHDASVGGITIEHTAAKSLALPTLGEVLKSFAGRAFLDIELKVAGLERHTLAELQKHPPQNGYVVSSFLPEVLSTIHELDSDIPLGFLCENREQLRGWRETPAEWVIPHYKLVDRKLIELVHAAGKNLVVWTVNRAEHLLEFASWGVDAIISDETSRLANILRAS